MRLESETSQLLTFSESDVRTWAGRLFWALITLALIGLTLQQIILYPAPQYSVTDRAIGGLLLLACALVTGYLGLSAGKERIVADKKARTITKTSTAILSKDEWVARFDQVERIEFNTYGPLAAWYSIRFIRSDGVKLYVTGDESKIVKQLIFDWNRRERYLQIAEKLSAFINAPLVQIKE